MSVPNDRGSTEAGLARTSTGVMSAQGAATLLQMLATLVAARLVAPESVGYVAWIGIWPVYATWLTLGVVSGAERAIPVRRGRNREGDIPEIGACAFTVTLLASGVCLAVGLLAAAIPALAAAVRWKFACAGVLCAAALFNNYVTMLLVTAKRFKLVGAKFVADSVLWWIFLPLVLYGTAGLTARHLLVGWISPVVFFIVVRGWRAVTFSRSVFLELSRVGLAILAARFLLSLAYSWDRTLVAVLMDDQALGFYMIAMVVISLMKPIPYSLGQVLYPTMGEIFGRTGSTREVARAMLRPLFSKFALVIPTVAAGWFLAEPLTRLLLPSYLPGVPAARIVLLAALFVPFMGAHSYYNAVRKQKTLIIMLLTGLLVETLVTSFLYLRAPTLTSFAWGMLSGMTTTAALFMAGILSAAALPPASPQT